MAVNNHSLPQGFDLRGRKPLIIFLLTEAAICAFFLYGQSAGWGVIATAVLVAPFQIAIWAILLKDDFWLLLGFAAVFPLSTLELLPYSYWRFVFYPANLLLFAFIIATRFLDQQRPDEGKIFMYQWLPLILFGSWIIITSIHTIISSLGIRKDAVLEYSLLGLVMIGVLFFFASVPKNLRQIKILISILVGSYIGAVLFLPFLKVLSLESLGGKTVLAPFGGYVNMNAVAVHVAVAALFLLGLLISVKNLAGKILGFLGVFILLAVLIITRSRGAWLGFGFGLLYLLFRTQSKSLLIVTAIGLMVLLTSDLFRETLLGRVGQTSLRDPSLAGRMILWAFALLVFKNNWFWGVGIENYRFVKHLYGFPAPMATASQYNTHNLFLEVLVDLGVIGLILFLWILVGTFIGVERSLRKRFSGDEFFGIMASVNAAMIAYAVHGLWDCLIWQHGAFILLGIILGLGVSIKRISGTRRGQE